MLEKHLAMGGRGAGTPASYKKPKNFASKNKD